MTPAQFNTIGDRLTESLLSGDFNLYQTVMTVPHHAVPRNGSPYTLNTLDELKADFDLYHQVLNIHQVTDIFRDIIAMVPRPDGQIDVMVETNILSNAHRIADPFRTQFTLVPHGDDWRITTVHSSPGHINWSRGHAEISPHGRFIDIDQRQSPPWPTRFRQTDGDDND